MSARVSVVGSANLDIVLSVDRRPGVGETVMGRALVETTGGKGVNQALAAAQIAPTHFIGSIGGDSAGSRVENALREGNVNVEHLARADTPTGRAYVTVTPDGENSIVVLGLANSLLSEKFAIRALDEAHPNVVLTQLEVPGTVTKSVLEWCKQRNVRLVFNPSPPEASLIEFAAHADPLIVNQHEASRLVGPSSGEAEELAAELSTAFLSVVVTAGPNGAFVGLNGRVTHVRGAAIGPVVDTTGAGDAFAGTLAAHLALGMELTAAAALANSEAGRLVQLARSQR